MKKWLYNFLALGIGIVISLILAEIVLQVYNPFASRVRGNEIVLPAGLTYEYNSIHVSGLDSHVLHTKNSMGFRGPEWDSAGEQDIRIYCVGGSTTECFYLSDGQDWPALLMKDLRKNGVPVWINNAGLDGHSTLGHTVLLRDYLLKKNRKPDCIIFLVGCNDVAASQFNKYENYHLRKNERWLQKSELLNLYLSWRMTRNASRAGMGHTPVDFYHVQMKDTTGWEKGKTDIRDTGAAAESLLAYGMRIGELGRMCAAAGVQPIFVTQPTILCGGVDPYTHRFNGGMEFQGKSGLHYWAVLSSYNEQLKAECRRGGWICVDAAEELPAVSDGYYDFFHYTRKGSERLAQLLGSHLKQEVFR